MKNFVDKESGVTVVEEPYIEDERDASRFIFVILLPLSEVYPT